MPFLRAFSSCLPERRVSNEQLSPLLGCATEWIREMTGISERRYAAGHETTASLGFQAAEKCLASAGLNAGDLGLILAASGSSERFCPGPASEIAARLGLASTPAIELPVASAGSLIALALAAELAGKFGRVLVIGTEIMSRRITLSPEAKNTAILFGDGAGACLIDPVSGFLRIADSLLCTDGNSSAILAVEADQLRMEGTSVILQAARKLPRAITELLARNALSPADAGQFLLHQANLNLIVRVAASLKAPQEKFFTNMERCGNPSSASMLIAADEYFAAHSTPPGPVVFSAFGTGINWGALLALPV
jgi:3-oxoacyl-[acyl-carrier-protein] synthase-3